MKARTDEVPQRTFSVPKINYGEVNYFESITWQNENVTEPPITKSLEINQIENFIQTKDVANRKLLKLPCHSLAVERAVKGVMEASANVCGYQSRHGLIKLMIQFRSEVTSFESKK